MCVCSKRDTQLYLRLGDRAVQFSILSLRSIDSITVRTRTQNKSDTSVTQEDVANEEKRRKEAIKGKLRLTTFN